MEDFPIAVFFMNFPPFSFDSRIFYCSVVLTYVAKVLSYWVLFLFALLIFLQIRYKSQPSSQKDSHRTSDWLPPTMARQEKSLAVCLEILQDYTAKDFSYFTVLTTADFHSNNSQFCFYRTIQTTWNSGTPPFHVLVVRHEEKCFFLSVAG